MSALRAVQTETADIASTGVAGEELRAFVERIENLEREIKDLNEGKSEVYGELKSRGFDVKIVKKIVAMRRVDPAERQEQEAILELYMHALGMSS